MIAMADSASWGKFSRWAHQAFGLELPEYAGHDSRGVVRYLRLESPGSGHHRTYDITHRRRLAAYVRWCELSKFGPHDRSTELRWTDRMERIADIAACVDGGFISVIGTDIEHHQDVPLDLLIAARASGLAFVLIDLIPDTQLGNMATHHG